MSVILCAGTYEELFKYQIQRSYGHFAGDMFAATVVW